MTVLVLKTYSFLGFACSHVRTVVATLGGQQGTAWRADQWRHLYAGFTVWLSETEATGNFSYFLFDKGLLPVLTILKKLFS